MSQVFQYLYDHMLHFLFWPALLLFVVFLTLDWLRTVWWKLRRDSSWVLPEGEPPPNLKLHARLERDNARRQNVAWNPAKYRVQHVPQPEHLKLED
jgi:hypothetical protein